MVWYGDKKTERLCGWIWLVGWAWACGGPGTMLLFINPQLRPSIDQNSSANSCNTELLVIPVQSYTKPVDCELFSSVKLWRVGVWCIHFLAHNNICWLFSEAPNLYLIILDRALLPHWRLIWWKLRHLCWNIISTILTWRSIEFNVLIEIIICKTYCCWWLKKPWRLRW